MNYEPIETQPIYIVVAQTVSLSKWYLLRIIKSIPCDMLTYNEIWKREINPLLNSMSRLQTFIFIREPDNPIKEMAEKNAKED